MTEFASMLAAWETYYVIVGSSGGALIGLQFVVITLIADNRRRTTEGELHAFGTPTVVHLAGALLVSALMTVPWHTARTLSIGIALIGLAGVGYSSIVIRRARRQKGYKPVLEDWVWYVAVPAVIYAGLTTAAVLMRNGSPAGLFAIAGAALGLLLIGIRNAWDTVTHLVVSEPRRK